MFNKNRRVVVTGLGMVTALGQNKDTTWENLVKSKSGIIDIKDSNLKAIVDYSKLASRIAGVSDLIEYNFKDKKNNSRIDRFIALGLTAAQEAIKDSEWTPKSEYELGRTGVVVGSGIGGLGKIESEAIKLNQSSTGRTNPFFIPASLINLLTGHIAIEYGFSGPNIALSTACATGAHCIAEAMRMIQYGTSDVIIAGGAEAPITQLGISGFGSLRALSTKYNDNPTKASRPWDKDRDGFVISEGAGILVLEELQHALNRNAKIYGEIGGCGLSCDAYHMTAPHKEGKGIIKAVNDALNDAKINKEEIHYINAHGTSTPVGDLIELNAIESLFYNANPKIKMSSTKSSLGHSLGATGAIETVISLLALKNNIVPPTLNLDNPEDTKINLVPHTAQEAKINNILSNSFGFGGTNASIIIKRYK